MSIKKEEKPAWNKLFWISSSSMKMIYFFVDKYFKEWVEFGYLKRNHVNKLDYIYKPDGEVM